MPDMFSSFQKAKPSQRITATDPYNPCPPYQGENNEFYWYYGESVTLGFDVMGELTLDSDDTIVKVAGEEPNLHTEGVIGAYFINIYDEKAWECISIQDIPGGKTYTWISKPYINPRSRQNYITAEDYIEGKKLKLTIYNFRGEPIICEFLETSTRPKFIISPQLSKEEFVRSTYYCVLELLDEERLNSEVIFDQNDAVFTVR